jgi:hypothetical protein
MRTSVIPHFLDIPLTDCSVVVSLTLRLRFAPEILLVLTSVRISVNSQGHSAAGKSRLIKKE